MKSMFKKLLSNKKVKVITALLLLSAATYFGIETYFILQQTPLFDSPSTIMQAFVNIPIVSAVIVGGFIQLAGMLFLGLFTEYGLFVNKVSFGKASFELSKKRKESNKGLSHLTFLATSSENHYSIMEDVFDKGDVNLENVLNGHLRKFTDVVNQTNEKELLKFSVLPDEDYLESDEKRLLFNLRRDNRKVGFRNKIADENILIGYVKDENGNEFIISILGCNGYRFDTFDVVVLEGIVSNSTVMVDNFNNMIKN